MKKVLFFTLLLITAQGICSAQEVPVGYSAEQLGLNFRQIAISEFANENPGQDTAVLGNRVQEYATEMAGIMLSGKVKPEDALSIMNNCAPWYAATLTRILKGDALNIYINDYIKQLTDLFSEYKLDLKPQSDIVLLTSVHLQKMNDLLNPSFYNYQ